MALAARNGAPTDLPGWAPANLISVAPQPNRCRIGRTSPAGVARLQHRLATGNSSCAVTGWARTSRRLRKSDWLLGWDLPNKKFYSRTSKSKGRIAAKKGKAKKRERGGEGGRKKGTSELTPGPDPSRGWAENIRSGTQVSVTQVSSSAQGQGSVSIQLDLGYVEAGRLDLG